MSNVEDMISWPGQDLVLGVLNGQKRDESCGHHDVVALVSTLPTYPCCALSKPRDASVHWGYSPFRPQ
ncbi:hypothetical protein EJ04DRAFT_451578 [Polyplosphaeria fusca]|uniref:Uncharacterized protein n=1 Tax=Polyplosphaeria fusca TaxID=682080 RepID=A0A9P4UT01_9PLEO|nr:hypothetical protein EJ04DRAFT_451578 [Polyplosphaeria fusca]